MNMEFFATLPSEIIIDILSRLPVRSVINCKCVCKSWLELVETREFVKSHLSNSVPGIAVVVVVFSRYDRHGVSSCGIVEFTDVLDIKHLTDERYGGLSLQPNAITKLHFPNSSSNITIWGSTDGLLLLRIINGYNMSESLSVCNPITREYIDLYSHQFVDSYSHIITYGFGSSKITGTYKVVVFFHTSLGAPKSKCKIYTIGIGSWRSIASDALLSYEYGNNGAFVNGNPHGLNYKFDNNGVFVNGNLHWLACDTEGSLLISCFDLETELFTTFFVPLPVSDSRTSHKRLCALEGCLCLFFNRSNDEAEIWLMNEYGVEKSWTKKIVINTSWVGPLGCVPFKVFKNGDILLPCDQFSSEDLFYYDTKNNTIRIITMPRHSYTPVLHVSSFLSLKSFIKENAISY